MICQSWYTGTKASDILKKNHCLTLQVQVWHSKSRYFKSKFRNSSGQNDLLRILKVLVARCECIHLHLVFTIMGDVTYSIEIEMQQKKMGKK